ncbi:MAG: pilin [Minisyncoccia bacterium]
MEGLDAEYKTCVIEGIAGATNSAAAGVTRSAQTHATQSFVPLTSIPGIAEAAASPDIATFLNVLYKICIGIAAVLAVVQIARGGITYMLGDGVTEKREARHHIYLAVFGLVLVLSPVIVFSIIDTRILDLKINTSGLTPDPSARGVSGEISAEAGGGVNEGDGSCSVREQLLTEASLGGWRDERPTGEITFGGVGAECCSKLRNEDENCELKSRTVTENGTDSIREECSCTTTQTPPEAENAEGENFVEYNLCSAEEQQTAQSLLNRNRETKPTGVIGLAGVMRDCCLDVHDEGGSCVLKGTSSTDPLKGQCECTK